MDKRKEQLCLLAPLLLGAVVFLIGITWGLPSRNADPFLFGSHPVWTGEQIVRSLGEPTSAGGSSRASLSIGADVDANPNRVRPVMLNNTDANRAEVLVRYRLYSAQPDEMITFRALSTIPKTHGDPRLYQYGGLWIYPVGVLLKVASLIGLVDVRSDLAFYLDHPEAFARFYIVARLYVVAFAMAGAWAVFWLARKMTGEPIVASLAACTYVLMPVVVNMAHEAKPHLPSAVLILFALIAAVRYVETSSRRHALIAGTLCGAACGLVLTGALSFILLPAMCYLRWRTRPPLAPSRLARAAADLALALLLGFAVYAITNPFVIIHLLGDRTVLLSNLENSQAMYRAPITPNALRTAATLITAGASPAVAIIGAASILLLRSRQVTRKLMFIVSIPIVAQFTMLATNKPGEYARFGIFIDMALLLIAFSGIAGFVKSIGYRIIGASVLCALTALSGAGYIWHFIRDASDRPSRIIAAERLQKCHELGAREVGTYSDPAPYCLPPVNLFDCRIVLLDPGAAPLESTDVLIRPTDAVPSQKDPPMRDYRIDYWIRPRIFDTPISWAHKPFRVIAKKEFLPADKD